MRSLECIIQDPRGIHARPWGRINEAVRQFREDELKEISLHALGKAVDPRKLMEVLAVLPVIPQFETVRIEARGRAAAKALASIKELIEEAREEVADLRPTSSLPYSELFAAAKRYQARIHLSTYDLDLDVQRQAFAPRACNVLVAQRVIEIRAGGRDAATAAQEMKAIIQRAYLRK